MQKILEGCGSIGGDGEEVVTYRLPSALLTGFEDIVTYIIAAGHVAKVAVEGYESKQKEIDELRNDKRLEFLHMVSRKAQSSASRARKTTLQMVRTGKAAQFVNFSAVERICIVLAIAKTLSLSALTDDVGVFALYRKCHSKLVSWISAL
jgi:DNA-binding Xre family transcriptional regulator